MSQQLIRFILVGGLNTLITMALFYLLFPSFGYVLAYSMVYVIGIAFAYILNSFFVFEAPTSWKSAIIYPLIYVAIYIYGVAVLAVMVDYFGLPAVLAVVLVVLSSVPLNFLLTRFLFSRVSGKERQ